MEHTNYKYFENIWKCNQRKWATLHSSRLGMDIFCKVLWNKTDSRQTNMNVLIVYNYYFYPSLKYYSGFLFCVLRLNNKTNVEMQVRSGDESRGSHVGRTKAQLTADQFATLIVANWLPLSSPPPFTHHITLHVLHCYAQLPLPSSLLLATLGNSCFLKKYFSNLEKKVSQALR